MSNRWRLGNVEVVLDRAGNVVPSAQVYVYADGTWNGSTSSPSGTAVTMYTTATGSTTATNPITTDTNGGWDVYTTYEGPFDVVCSTNGASTSSYGFRRRVDTVPEAWVDADASTDNNSLPAAHRGTLDVPYGGGAGLLQAYSDLAGTANNAAVPITIRIRGSSGVDTSPSLLTLPSALDIGIGCRIVGPGGGDADRERASVLITGSVDGSSNSGLINIKGRFVDLQNIAVSNTHTAGIGISVNPTSVSGGFQDIHMAGVHVYDCGSTGLSLVSFNTDLSTFERCKFLWNGRTTDAYGVLVTSNDGTPDSTPNAIMFLGCEIAHNSKGQVGLIQSESNPKSGDVVYFLNTKGHGSRTRFDIQGWHDVVIDGYYLESSSSALDTDQPIIKVRKGTGGATSTFYSYGITVRGRGRMHDTTRQTAASTTLTAAITDVAATTLSVTATTGFPSVATGYIEPFTITIDSENMRVMAMSSGSHLTWTVIRGVDGTSAATHSNGATVTKSAWTAGVGTQLDIDECVEFDVSGVTVMAADSTSSNPHVVLGTNATRGKVRLAIHTSGQDRGSQVTTVANLFSNVSRTNSIEWWDGTIMRHSGDKAGEIYATATWNPANLAAVGDVTSTTVTATGARAGDIVDVNFSDISTNKVIMFAWVSTDDTVTVLLQNQEGVNLNLPSGTLAVRVRRPT